MPPILHKDEILGLLFSLIEYDTYDVVLSTKTAQVGRAYGMRTCNPTAKQIGLILSFLTETAKMKIFFSNFVYWGMGSFTVLLLLRKFTF